MVTTKVVKPHGKGQITIPNEFREALGITTDTLLTVSIVDDHLEIAPLVDRGSIRRYSEEDIARFLEEDRLDPDTAQRVRDLVARG
jgi:AbrB family looped-hinge helix DNA binding protein